ncbi:MAG: hypothetical protein RIQ53_3389 [Pseudomonadota bacterium]
MERAGASGDRPTAVAAFAPPVPGAGVAAAIAREVLDGFDRHYRLFRESSRAARARFEAADWAAQQQAQAERIAYYERRVAECVERLRQGLGATLPDAVLWARVKRHYIGWLLAHQQPELAETFFNSVTTRLLHRRDFRNDCIFVRPTVSTEYIDDDEPQAAPTYRAYYPARPGHDGDDLHRTLRRVVQGFGLQRPFEDLDRDIGRVLGVLCEHLPDGLPRRANFQIQVLSSLFYRNKGAYLIGRIVNGNTEIPMALPILHGDDGRLRIDAALFTEDDLLRLFSFARAYFMVDIAIPSACVQFLRGLMPRKPRSELYTAIGLHKQGKNAFYRDFLHHLRHSSDRFELSAGIRGMVMLVFDLPSFPYVFKVIRDHFAAPKETTRAQVQAKYLLVKAHDRVGRMADTAEYASVPLPRARISEALMDELRRCCASQIEEDGEQLIIHHVYIERRMIPLNIWLQDATPAQLAHAVIEYGNAIKDLVAANIFPGDMLWKNFGMTRHGKVVFYDYDEIEYLSDCRFRQVPPPRDEDDEMSGEVWYAVGPRDVFPETFAPFLLGHPAVREVFMRHHADLLDPAFWQSHQARILAGHVHDVFPYDPHKRFPSSG